MSKIFLEILDDQRKETFEKLRPFEDACYLAGGTALALQVGHRRSFDFDLFTSYPIDRVLLQKVRDVFGNVKYSLNTSDQITFTTKENISITFLYYWFPLLNKTITTSSLPLASIFDILADKAHTIGRGAVWRDYVDIFYTLSQNHSNIKRIITDAKKKFGGEFVNEQFLEQLVYYDDIKFVNVDWLKDVYKDEEIKHVLQTKVREYIREMR